MSSFPCLLYMAIYDLSLQMLYKYLFHLFTLAHVIILHFEFAFLVSFCVLNVFMT